MRRVPARPVRARFVRWWWAAPRVGLETPHFTLRTYTSQSALHLVISSDLCSPHLSPLLNLSTAQLFSSHRNSSQLILFLLPVTKLLLPSRSLLHTKFMRRGALCTETLNTDAFTQKASAHKEHLHMSIVYTQHTVAQRSTAIWYIQKTFTHRNLLHTARFYTQQSSLKRHFFKQKVFTHRNFNTQHSFPQRIFYRQQTLTRKNFPQRNFWETFTQMSLCTFTQA